MNQILVIEGSPFLRKHLNQLMEKKGINVSFVDNCREGIFKMRSILPDVIIMDLEINRMGFMELLRQKKKDTRTENVPVILIANHVEKKRQNILKNYNVITIIKKTFKFDTLINLLSGIFKFSFIADENPGQIDVHVNDNIIFIKITKGLNQDKLDLLRIKIHEQLSIYLTRNSKVFITFHDIRATPDDESKMTILFNTVLQSSKAKPENIKVLSNDDYVRDFIIGKKELKNIEVFSNIQIAVKSIQPWIEKNPDHVKSEIESIVGQMITEENKNILIAVKPDGAAPVNDISLV